MTGPGFRFACTALLPMLLLGAASCAPLFDRPKLVEIRPVETPKVDGIAADENAYRSATRAIEDRDYALALEHLQAARERQPADVRVLNAFGVVYDKLGRFDLSARYYARARAIDPRSTIVLANIAYSRALQELASGQPATDALADATSQTNTKLPPSSSIPPAPATERSALLTTAGPPVSAQAVTGDHLANLPAHGLQAAEPKPISIQQSRPIQTATAQSAITRPAAQPPAPIAAADNSSGLAPARVVAAGMPLLTGHPLIIVNASGRKGATEAMRRRLVRLGWTAPRWAARDGADRGHTTLFFAQPYSAAAHALAHTLRFSVRLAASSCGCGGLKLVVGRDFLRRVALADNLEPDGEDSGGAGDAASPTISKEHHHVPAKA